MRLVTVAQAPFRFEVTSVELPFPHISDVRSYTLYFVLRHPATTNSVDAATYPSVVFREKDPEKDKVGLYKWCQLGVTGLMTEGVASRFNPSTNRLKVSIDAVELRHRTRQELFGVDEGERKKLEARNGAWGRFLLAFDLAYSKHIEEGKKHMEGSTNSSKPKPMPKYIAKIVANYSFNRFHQLPDKTEYVALYRRRMPFPVP